VVQPARHRPDGRALPGRPGSRALRRLLRCSENKWTYRDIEHARAVVGFVPEDRAEDHRPR
jgi:hypothetical protein